MKDKNLAGFLALIFGGLGFHKFYLNRPGQGLLYLVFSWTFIPAFISFFEAMGYFFADQNSFNLKYNQESTLPMYSPTAEGLTQDSLVDCPYCAEKIQSKAIFCKHCKKELK